MVAVRCLGELLITHSHFNFTSNIVQALVPLLNHPYDAISDLTASYFTKLFKVDKAGYYSFEVRPIAAECLVLFVVDGELEFVLLFNQ